MKNRFVVCHPASCVCGVAHVIVSDCEISMFMVVQINAQIYFS